MRRGVKSQRQHMCVCVCVVRSKRPRFESNVNVVLCAQRRSGMTSARCKHSTERENTMFNNSNSLNFVNSGFTKLDRKKLVQYR